LFSIGTASNTNVNTVQFVAYCFAEIPGYSKIGSYVGNGSSDGPFVFCGFRPRWLLVKRTDVTGSWWLLDTTRNTSNQVTQHLRTNTADSEYSSGQFDFVSGGFKLRGIDSDWNTGGATYIFMAIAEANFKYANAR
jgi:hypothetical protein